MGMKANSNNFRRTKGALKYLVKKSSSSPPLNLFTNKGHTNYQRIAKNREIFYNKSVGQIGKILNQEGYETTIRPSKHADSKAKMIVVKNYGEKHNITFVEVSPGSARHGNIPYVRISTTDIGKIKIINGTKAQYKTDNSENAKLIFKRRKKK